MFTKNSELVLRFNQLKANDHAEKTAKIRLILDELDLIEKDGAKINSNLAITNTTPGAPLIDGVKYDEKRQSATIELPHNSSTNLNDINEKLKNIEGIKFNKAVSYYGIHNSKKLIISDCILDINNESSFSHIMSSSLAYASRLR